MRRRYLFGPVPAEFAAQKLGRQREDGLCLAFNAVGDTDLTIKPGDSWPDVCSRLPAGWEPDYLVLSLPYTTVPECLWSAPVPAVALALDWRLLWHGYRLRLRPPTCDLVLTDPQGAATFTRAGLDRVESASLRGVERYFLQPPEKPVKRDIDILVAGNVNPAIHPDRAALLPRLARLGERWRVAFHPAASGPALRDLLCRSRVVVHQGAGWSNDALVFAAPLCGALLFQDDAARPSSGAEAGLPQSVFFNPANLESLLDDLLSREDERQQRVEASRALALGGAYESLWQQCAERIDERWDDLHQHRLSRAALPQDRALLARCWQSASAAGAEDPGLVRDLEAALRVSPDSPALHNALGLALSRADRNPAVAAAVAAVAAARFRAAVSCDPTNPVARLNLAEALLTSGQGAAALEEIDRALRLLDHAPLDPAPWLDDGHYRLDYGPFRMEWERAAWANAGDPAAEREAKLALLRSHLHTLASREAQEKLPHLYEAVLARPDLPAGRARLGAALAATQPTQAVAHLQAAVRANPLDREAARALFGALGATSDETARRRLARDRRFLHRAMPQLLPDEPWFAHAAPVGDELVSIVIPCCNQLEYTKLCLESVLRHTRSPYELILVDNASDDGTACYLQELRGRPGPARVEVVTNDNNLGFPAACNQGLARAQGRYLAFLHNDTLVTSGWLDGLLAPLLSGWPHVGIVGPVSSVAPDPQRIPIDYEDTAGVDPFAARRKRTHAGHTLDARQVSGFCLLTRRDVIDRTGGFDERYGAGFCEDADLCVRARQAGFRIVVALDVFIHHFGSRTFRALGIDPEQQWQQNVQLLQARWGPEQTAGSPSGPPLPLAGRPRPLPRACRHNRQAVRAARSA